MVRTSREEVVGKESDFAACCAKLPLYSLEQEASATYTPALIAQETRRLRSIIGLGISADPTHKAAARSTIGSC